MRWEKTQKEGTLLEWKRGAKCKKQKIIRKQEERILNIYSVMSKPPEMEHGQRSTKCKINMNTSGARKLQHWLALFLAGSSVFNNNYDGELHIEGWSLSRLLWLILCSGCEKQKSCQTTNPLSWWWGVKVTLHFFSFCDEKVTLITLYLVLCNEAWEGEIILSDLHQCTEIQFASKMLLVEALFLY